MCKKAGADLVRTITSLFRENCFGINQFYLLFSFLTRNVVFKTKTIGKSLRITDKVYFFLLYYHLAITKPDQATCLYRIPNSTSR